MNDLNVTNVLADRKGQEQWLTIPKRADHPKAGITVTSSKVYYPVTGLLEERVTVEEYVRRPTFSQ